MPLLFTRISLNSDSISINLTNYSFQSKQTEFNLTELKKYLSELVDFEYEYVNIDNEISIYLCNENIHKNCFIRWHKLDKERILEIAEEIIEEIPFEGEIN
jgi:hypothetical protein